MTAPARLGLRGVMALLTMSGMLGAIATAEPMPRRREPEPRRPPPPAPPPDPQPHLRGPAGLREEYCFALSPWSGKYQCTRPKGHWPPWDHIAHGPTHGVLATWQDPHEETEEERQQRKAAEPLVFLGPELPKVSIQDAYRMSDAWQRRLRRARRGW